MKQTGKLDYLEMPATGGTLDRVKAFYSAAFSWSFTDYGPTYSAFAEGLDGGFQADAAEAPAKPLPVLYSENLEETLARRRKRRRHDREADLLLSRRPALSFRRSGRQRDGGLGRIGHSFWFFKQRLTANSAPEMPQRHRPPSYLFRIAASKNPRPLVQQFSSRRFVPIVLLVHTEYKAAERRLRSVRWGVAKW